MSSIREWDGKQYLDVDNRQAKRRRIGTPVQGACCASSDGQGGISSPCEMSDTPSVGATSNSSPCFFSDAEIYSSGYMGWPTGSFQTAQQTPEHNAGLLLNDTPDPEMICFGMITDITMSKVKMIGYREPGPYTPAILRGARVSTQTEQSYIGDVSADIADILAQLESQSGMIVQSFCRHMLIEKDDRMKGRQKVPELVLCVVLYGPHTLSEAVSNFLQECNLYLQDPCHCKWNVPYSNPQRLFDLSDIPTMTFDLDKHHEEVFESYDNPADILADLEHQGNLHETETPSAIKTELKTHQRTALTFMKRRERGLALGAPGLDIWQSHRDGNGLRVYVNGISEERTYAEPRNFKGGILGDTMGLGKTLSAIALVASDKDCPPSLEPGLLEECDTSATLVVVRAPLLKEWTDQLNRHIRPGHMFWRTHHGSHKITSAQDIQSCDIVITTYHTILAEYRKYRDFGVVMSTCWRRIILDEAHDIRDHGSMICRVICSLNASRRWALTGTPIQNRLLDLASLCQFLRVDPIAQPSSFKAFTSQLVSQFGQESATQRLRQMIRCIMLRRSREVVSLAPRKDLIRRLNFNTEEFEAYEALGRRTLDSQRTANPDQGKASAFQMIAQLRMLCNLGSTYRRRNVDFLECDAWNESVAQSTFDDLISAAAANCSACGVDLSTSTTEAADHDFNDRGMPLLFSCKWLVCPSCISLHQQVVTCACSDNHGQHAAYLVSALSQASDAATTVIDTQNEMPTKIAAVLEDIRLNAAEEKCIVFSFWTSTLDLIEQGLKEKSIAYIRYDGKTSQAKRAKDLDLFSTNPGIRVALLTISCGAVGLNLTAASRAILCEPHWNPSVEQQALARIHRMGQTRPVTTVRYIMRNTIEDYVVKIQHEKKELSQLLLSDPSGTANQLEYLRSTLR